MAALFFRVATLPPETSAQTHPVLPNAVSRYSGRLLKTAGVGVAVGVAVAVGVGVAVDVGVRVSVGVAVLVGVSVGVLVFVGVEVGVEVGVKRLCILQDNESRPPNNKPMIKIAFVWIFNLSSLSLEMDMFS